MKKKIFELVGNGIRMLKGSTYKKMFENKPEGSRRRRRARLRCIGDVEKDFIFMLPYIVINLFLITNQMHQLFKFILLQYSACFGHLLCLSSGDFYCTFSTGKFLASLMAASKQSQFHPDYAWKRSSENCMKLTSAECTEDNS
jgi:hypothetical protein